MEVVGEKELAEDELDGAQKYRTRVEEAQLPDDVREAALREVGKLERTSDQSPESDDIRTWLDTILDLPWSTGTTDWIDIQGSREVEANLRRLIEPAVAADLEEGDTGEVEGVADADLEEGDTGEVEAVEGAGVRGGVPISRRAIPARLRRVADADLEEGDTGEVEAVAADLEEGDTGEVEGVAADLEEGDTGEVEAVADADLEEGDTGEVEAVADRSRGGRYRRG